jgi:tetratricopeptide (TPR) repeat protein
MKRTLLTCLLLITVTISPPSSLADSESADIKRLIALTKAHSYMKANNLLDRMIEVDPTNPQLRLAGAHLYRQMGLFARSMSEYKQLMRADPNLIEPVIALSQMNMEYLNLPQALSLARVAVGIDPSNREARIALCSALIASDYLKEAEDELDKLQKQSGHDPEVNYVAYKLYLKRGQLPKARQELEGAMTIDPSNGQWLLDMSELCKLQGDYEEANRYLQRGLDNDPISVDKLNQMAILQEYFFRDYDLAMVQYRKILEIDPDSVTAMAGLDRCKTKKNDLAGMLKNQLRALFIAWRRLN